MTPRNEVRLYEAAQASWPQPQGRSFRHRFHSGGIFKRGELGAEGGTNAATIWFVNVMGLCFGGGQIRLGFAGFLFGFAVLAGLTKFETRMSTRYGAILKVRSER